jgi:hypothetical protein
VTTTVVVAAPARSLLDRVVAALPVLTVFFWLCLVYAIESWGHLTPWLFTDELEMTQLARSIAETGEAARRGEPHFFESLFTYLLAPAWWIDDTETAYSAAKYIGVLTMTSVVFPAYWLARLLVPSLLALFAAAASGAIPAFLYSSMFVEETLAYPYATLCLFLIVKGLATRRQGWLGGALFASLLAPLVRMELAVLPAVYLIAVLFLVWTSAEARRRRASWSRWDWVGALTLFVGVLIVLNAVIAHRSFSWFVATTHYKERMIDNGLWAAGALVIGLGVLPVIAGLAALVRPRDEVRTPAERAFIAVTIASILGFGWYTAVKASYISTVFSTLVVERNLIYVAPLLFAGTAWFFQRPRLHPVPVVLAAAFALYLVVTTPFKLDAYPYSDAPGLAIAQGANRTLGLAEGTIEAGLIAAVIVATALCLAPLLLRGRRALLRPLLAVTAAAVLAWNLTGQLAAADGSRILSNQLISNYPRPLNWLDRLTGGEPAMYLGRQITDANGIWLMEFWNRSLRYVWSIDGTAKGPGPTLSPDLLAPDGSITSAPDIRYVVVDEGINLVGDVVAPIPHGSGGLTKYWRVYRIHPPLRLAESTTGIYDDGWAGETSTYARFSTPGNQPGFAVVAVSRQAWAGHSPPGNVVISVGELVLKNKQPAMGRVTKTVRWTIRSGGFQRFYIPTPRPPIRVEVRITPTFVPGEIDPNSSELREFGAQVSFDWTAQLPR